MSEFDKKKHWENIYTTKELTNVSWYQPTPQTSLDFLHEFAVPKSAKIIDVGGGDSFFVDHLLERGFTNVSVLDISEAAIERAKSRLGDRANMVNWIVADAADFHPTDTYDFWHDRAAFHFLTDEDDIENYIQTASKHISNEGTLVIGTFSENGPQKCSGIEIKQYSDEQMVSRLNDSFDKVRCFTIDHETPFDTIQNFVFCSFRKKQL